MISKMAEQVYTRHPILFMFIIGITGVSLLHVYTNFAQAEEVRKVEKQVEELTILMDFKFTEQRLSDVERDIYELERLAEQQKANDRDLKRLDDLKIEKSKIKRQLSKSKN